MTFAECQCFAGRKNQGSQPRRWQCVSLLVLAVAIVSSSGRAASSRQEELSYRDRQLIGVAVNLGDAPLSTTVRNLLRQQRRSVSELMRESARPGRRWTESPFDQAATVVPRPTRRPPDLAARVRHSWLLSASGVTDWDDPSSTWSARCIAGLFGLAGQLIATEDPSSCDAGHMVVTRAVTSTEFALAAGLLDPARCDILLHPLRRLDPVSPLGVSKRLAEHVDRYEQFFVTVLADEELRAAFDFSVSLYSEADQAAPFESLRTLTAQDFRTESRSVRRALRELNAAATPESPQTIHSDDEFKARITRVQEQIDSGDFGVAATALLGRFVVGRSTSEWYEIERRTALTLGAIIDTLEKIAREDIDSADLITNGGGHALRAMHLLRAQRLDYGTLAVFEDAVRDGSACDMLTTDVGVSIRESIRESSRCETWNLAAIVRGSGGIATWMRELTTTLRVQEATMRCAKRRGGAGEVAEQFVRWIACVRAIGSDPDIICSRIGVAEVTRVLRDGPFVSSLLASDRSGLEEARASLVALDKSTEFTLHARRDALLDYVTSELAVGACDEGSNWDLCRHAVRNVVSTCSDESLVMLGIARAVQQSAASTALGEAALLLSGSRSVDDPHSFDVTAVMERCFAEVQEAIAAGVIEDCSQIEVQWAGALARIRAVDEEFRLELAQMISRIDGELAGLQ